MSFSFGDINSKMKASTQFAHALNSLSQARRIMQGSPTKQGNTASSSLFPDRHRAQKTHKSIENKPFL